MLSLHTIVGATLYGALSYAAPEPQVDAGHHVAISDDDHLVVSTQWLSRGASKEVPLALALPPTASVSGADSLRGEDGAIVAIVTTGVEPVFEVRVSLADARRLGAVPLAIPDAPGTHRVTFDRAVAFEPGIELGLSQRLTRAATAGVPAHPRRWLDPRLDALPDDTGVSRYASTEAVVQAGGFVGRVERARTHRRRLLLWAGAGFILVAAALAAVYRRLRRGAELERAEAMLAQEFDALGP